MSRFIKKILFNIEYIIKYKILLLVYRFPKIQYMCSLQSVECEDKFHEERNGFNKINSNYIFWFIIKLLNTIRI